MFDFSGIVVDDQKAEEKEQEERQAREAAIIKDIEAATPRRYRGKTWADFNEDGQESKKLHKVAVRHVEAIKERTGLSYVICGSSGVGKSFVSWLLYRDFTLMGVSCVVIDLADIMARVHESFKIGRDPLPELSRVQVLIIDEFGKTPGRDFERRKHTGYRSTCFCAS